MPTRKKKIVALPTLGDRVKIRHVGGMRGRVVELRGLLGTGGAQVYRVMARWKPTPADVEVRGDQLELLPAKG